MSRRWSAECVPAHNGPSLDANDYSSAGQRCLSAEQPVRGLNRASPDSGGTGLPKRPVLPYPAIHAPPHDPRHDHPVDRPGRETEHVAGGQKTSSPSDWMPSTEPHRLRGARKVRSGRPANSARMLCASNASPRLRAELRSGSVAATSPIAKTPCWPGTRSSGVTRTKPSSSSSSGAAIRCWDALARSPITPRRPTPGAARCSIPPVRW